MMSGGKYICIFFFTYGFYKRITDIFVSRLILFMKNNKGKTLHCINSFFFFCLCKNILSIPIIKRKYGRARTWVFSIRFKSASSQNYKNKKRRKEDCFSKGFDQSPHRARCSYLLRLALRVWSYKNISFNPGHEKKKLVFYSITFKT